MKTFAFKAFIVVAIILLSNSCTVIRYAKTNPHPQGAKAFSDLHKAEMLVENRQLNNERLHDYENDYIQHEY